ncbi:MAG: hypothetical protein V3R84_02575 [Acidimicrobiia bacterium]
MQEPQAREPLRDRFPDYMASFSVMAGLAMAIGLVVALFSSVSYSAGAGYGLMLLGVGMLAVGGTQGGGYASLGVGAVGMLFGSRRHDEDYSDERVRRGTAGRVDPRQRLRKGLRPEANPSAFWLVIGGLVAIGAGIGLLNSLG